MAAPAAPAPLAPATLPRVIGTRGFALAVINCVVGAGVFGLPALIAADLGRNALLALGLATGAAMLALVLIAIRDRPRGDEAGFGREFGTEGSDEGAALVAPAPERPGRAR